MGNRFSGSFSCFLILPNFCSHYKVRMRALHKIQKSTRIKECMGPFPRENCYNTLICFLSCIFRSVQTQILDYILQV